MSSPAPRAQNPSSNGRRSSSLGFLRRSKSSDLLSERKTSGSRLGRSKQRETEEQLRRRQAEANTLPKLPTFSPELQIQYHQATMTSNAPNEAMRVKGTVSPVPPVPPIPNLEKEAVDPYGRTESMTHRGRYSYANSTISTLNSPRRVRRRKDPSPYNVLVIGAKNSGKTSFLNFLKKSLALPPKKQPIRDASNETPPPSAKSNRNYVHHYQEIEIESERVGLTIWDSQGLEKGVVDLQLREMSSFVESKFEDTFIEEMKVVRAPGVRDTHIHCVFFILDPSRLDTNIQAANQPTANGSLTSKFGRSSRIIGGLDEDFDLQVFRTLQGKTTVVPIISKADTVSTAHMAFLKKTVWESLKMAGLDPLEALNFQMDDEDGEETNRVLDERDEDEVARKENADVESENGSTTTPMTEDSEALQTEERFPNVKRQISSKQPPTTTFSTSNPVFNSGFIPLSILSPDPFSLLSADGPIGRSFPWGFADPYNPSHCDFVKLKDSCVGEWRADLREASREIFYEKWRTSRLNRQGGQGGLAGANTNGVRATMEPRKISGSVPITNGGIPNGILRGKGQVAAR